MSLSNYLELELLDHVFGCGTLDYPVPANIYVSLHTADPTDANLTATEVSSVARVAANSWATAASRATYNSASITFAAMTVAATVTHVGLYDTARAADGVAAGNLLAYAELDEEQTFAVGNVPVFAAGRIGVSFTTGVISDYLANKLLDHVFKVTAWANPVVATYASHDADTETITTTGAHGLTDVNNGMAMMLTTTGTPPGGLTAGTLYYFKYVGATSFTLHATAAGAIAGTGTVNLDATVAVGTNTFHLRTGYVSHVAATDVITTSAHGMTTADDGTALMLTTTDTAPGGLTAGTLYYFHYESATTLTLYTTAAYAIAGGATGLVDLSAAEAVGLNTFYSRMTYVSLYTTEPGDDDSGSELSGSGYSRIFVAPTSDAVHDSDYAAWTVATGATALVTTDAAIENSAGAPFTAADAAWMQINYLAIHDAATSGNLLFYGASVKRPTLAVADTYVIATGNLSITLD